MALWDDVHHLAVALASESKEVQFYLDQKAWLDYEAWPVGDNDGMCYGKQFYISLDVMSTICATVRYFPGRIKIDWLGYRNHCRVVLGSDELDQFRRQRLSRSLNWTKISEFLLPRQKKGKVDAAFYRFVYSLLTSHRYSRVTKAAGLPGCQVLDLLTLRRRFNH